MLKRNQYSTDRFLKSVYNVGYLGEGDYKTVKNDIYYSIWHSMLRRCFSNENKNINYVNCFVDEKWHNFQTFVKWCEINYVDNWHLDKDILFFGNKIYSETTCCFIPTQINSILQNRISIKKSGLPLGVTKSRKKFLVSLSKFNVALTFGTYNTIEEASKVFIIEKEKYIKEVAELWKDKIPDNVYQVLIKFKY